MWCHRGPEGGGKGPTLQLAGVTVPVLTFKARLGELQALAHCLPVSQDSRRRYRMVTRAKPVGWPRVRWAAVDDSRLLVGVMKHGIGNWDSIRDDPELNLGNKVADSSSVSPGNKPRPLRFCWRTSLGSLRHLIF